MVLPRGRGPGGGLAAGETLGQIGGPRRDVLTIGKRLTAPGGFLIRIKARIASGF